MGRRVTFGLGGWCEHCDPSHDHPSNNILSIEEVPDPVLEAKPDVQALAEALTQLPEETLNALKQALGL